MYSITKLGSLPPDCDLADTCTVWPSVYRKDLHIDLELPYELKALEIALAEAIHNYEMELCSLEQKANDALDSLAQKVGRQPPTTIPSFPVCFLFCSIKWYGCHTLHSAADASCFPAQTYSDFAAWRFKRHKL